jgi:hypothetical protein
MRTTTIRKPFSRALYDKADGKAKEIMRTYLQGRGHKLKEDKEKYYCDIEGEDGHGWEVEIKYSWKGEWPTSWMDVRIPHRKKRLIDKKGKDNITFYVLNSMCDQAWEITGDVVSGSEVTEVSNKFVPKGELFYSIFVSQAKKIFLTGENEYDTVHKS